MPTEENIKEHDLLSHESPLDPIVYQQLRAEMTAILSSCRNLHLLQYGTVVLLLSYILSNATPTIPPAPSLVVPGVFLMILAGILTISTWIGRIWFESAMRQGAYLLVAFELPDFREKGSSWAHWIIANRSQSDKDKNDKYKGKYLASYGLKSFYVHQLLLIFFSGTLSYIAIFALNDCTRVINSFWVYPPLVFFAIGIGISFWGRLMADKTMKEQIRKWNEYIRERARYDTQLDVKLKDC